MDPAPLSRAGTPILIGSPVGAAAVPPAAVVADPDAAAVVLLDLVPLSSPQAPRASVARASATAVALVLMRMLLLGRDHVRSMASRMQWPRSASNFHASARPSASRRAQRLIANSLLVKGLHIANTAGLHSANSESGERDSLPVEGQHRSLVAACIGA